MLIESLDNRSFEIEIVNDVVFIKSNNYIDTSYVGIIDKNNYYETILGSDLTETFIINSFNLYSIRQIGTGQTYRAYLIYNINNYNGVSFNGEKSVNSNSVVLYEGNIPIFARNLYNKTIVDNTEESTVNVPTYMLNGILIDKQELISKNNNIIIENTDSIEKNIYENVLINFFDEITIKDNDTIRIPASSYFVNGINEDKDVSATKYRVTYKNGDILIGNISDITLNGTDATIKFMINTKNGVSKLEVISKDEEVAYSILDLSNAVIEDNSYYLYTQNITIGDD